MDSCFAGVIGYHLSLKSAVEKCRVAVEYPPTGLPLVLAGEKGTGKRLLAGKTWEYAKEKQVVPAESRFAELDCAMWGAAEPGGTGRFVQTQAGGWHRQRFFVPARL